MDVNSQQAGASPQVKALATLLRNKSAITNRTGILDGKRVDYFKGRSAVKALTGSAYGKAASKKSAAVPSVESEDQACEHLAQLNRHAYFLKVERGDHVPPPPGPSGSAPSSSSTAKQPRMIRVDRLQSFTQDGYYMWCIDAPQWKTMLGAVGLVTAVLAGCMFPLWPNSLRIGVWYLSIGVLGLIGAFFGLAVIRLIFWLITKVAYKPGIWIFPKLFDDVGFVESFIPLWAWDLPPQKKSKRKVQDMDRNGHVEPEAKASLSKRKLAVDPDQQTPSIVVVEDGA